MNEEEAREHYVTIQALRKQKRQLEGRLEELDEKMTEIREMISHVQKAVELPADEDILVPLTNGVFMPAKTVSSKTVFLNVGGGAVVEKDPDGAIAILEKQQEELERYRESLRKQAIVIEKNLDAAEQQAAQHLED